MLLMAEEKETPRLYSNEPRCPVDVVATQHVDIHAELERWGRWNADPYKAASSSIVERYIPPTPPATGHGVDPRLIALERAVLRLPAKHRDTVRLFYVAREDARTICRILKLRYEGFPSWMFIARAMVLNLLRRHGNG